MSSTSHRTDRDRARAWGTIAVGDEPTRFEFCAATGRRTVAACPDFAMATKWSRSLKRIHHIEICERAGTEMLTAWIHGTGHRSPTTRRISLSTAIALGLRRVPVLMALDQPATS